MPFPPPHDHSISREAAVALIMRYRENTKPGAQLATMFPRDVYERLLAQPGCAGVRAYDGLAEDGTRQTILVGVDEDGNDMAGGLMFDTAYPCPPYCNDPPEGGLAGQ